MKKLLVMVVAAAAGVLSAADAYLEGTGAQIIDSGYYVNGNTRIELDFQLMSNDKTVNKQVRLLGHNDQDRGGNDNFLQLYCSDDNVLMLGYGNSFTAQSIKQGDLLRHTFVYDAPDNKAWIDSNSPITLSAAHDKTATLSLAVFGRHFKYVTYTPPIQPRYDYATKMRIYSLKIYEKSGGEYVLVKDFQPIVDADGRGKLKDAVSNNMYDNRMSDAPFLYGGDIDDRSVYVQGYGSQVIDSGYFMNANSRVEVDFQLTATTPDQLRIFGQSCDDRSGNDNFTQFYVANGRFILGYGNSFTKVESLPAVDLKRHTIIYDSPADKVMLITGVTTNAATLSVAHDKASTLSMAIGGRHFRHLGYKENGVAKPIQSRFDCGAPMKIFSVKIYEKVGGEYVLVRSYRPVVDTSGTGKMVIDYSDNLNAVCEDANGGAYAYGGDIFTYCDEAYLESDGTQAIALGHKPTKNTRYEIDYQFTALEAQKRAFGSVGGGLDLEVFLSSAVYLLAGRGDLSGGGTWQSQWSSVGGANVGDLKRRTNVLDYKNGRFFLGRESGVLTAAGADQSAHEVVVFGRRESWGGGADQYAAFAQCAKMKLYAFRIYENNILQHQFLPYKNGDVVGLYDTETGTVRVNGKTGANAFVYGEGRCNNYEGAVPEAFVVAPKAKYGVSPMRAAVISVLAPGAYRYEWKKNGMVVEGADAATLEVPCEEVRDDEVYTVQAVYLIDGVEVAGPTAETVVSQTGFMIIVR